MAVKRSNVCPSQRQLWSARQFSAFEQRNMGQKQTFALSNSMTHNVPNSNISAKYTTSDPHPSLRLCTLELFQLTNFIIGSFAGREHCCGFLICSASERLMEQTHKLCLKIYFVKSVQKILSTWMIWRSGTKLVCGRNSRLYSGISTKTKVRNCTSDFVLLFRYILLNIVFTVLSDIRLNNIYWQKTTENDFCHQLSTMNSAHDSRWPQNFKLLFHSSSESRVGGNNWKEIKHVGWTQSFLVWWPLLNSKTFNINSYCLTSVQQTMACVPIMG